MVVWSGEALDLTDETTSGAGSGTNATPDAVAGPNTWMSFTPSQREDAKVTHLPIKVEEKEDKMLQGLHRMDYRMKKASNKKMPWKPD